MTTGKRALIVDDSRSARVILSRMLEQHGMTVDTAESAEQALEYLQQSRPDVIFMDHLMPGMDGFQAVQAIKADPQTATIPLMMYTSQEGELYVSQARALGAVGVLPKTVRPVDVSRDSVPAAPAAGSADPAHGAVRRAAAAALAAWPARGMPRGAGGAQTAPRRPSAPARRPLPPAPLAPSPASTVTPALCPNCRRACASPSSSWSRTSSREQRRFMLATFEAFARRLGTEMKESIGKDSAARRTSTALPPTASAASGGRSCSPRCCGVIPAVVLGYLSWQASTTNRPSSQVAELKPRSPTGRKGRRRPPPAPQRPQSRHRSAGHCPRAPRRRQQRRRPRRGPACDRVRALWRDPAGQQSARSAARAGRDARDAAVQGPHPRRVLRRRLLPGRQRGRGFRVADADVPRRSATWSAIRSTTRCRRRSGSRSTSPTSPRRCAGAPAATSSSTSSAAGQPARRVPRAGREGDGGRVEHRRGAEQPRRVPRHARRMTRRGFVIYGANGYTGELIAREAVRRGLRPVLAGRNRDAIDDCSQRNSAASIASRRPRRPRRADRALQGVDAVLHCAGPFSATAAPMLQACLAAGTPLSGHHRRNRRFRGRARIGRGGARGRRRAVPGRGLRRGADRLRRRALTSALPDATYLALGFDSRPAGESRDAARPRSKACRAADASAARARSRRRARVSASATSISATA